MDKELGTVCKRREAKTNTLFEKISTFWPRNCKNKPIKYFMPISLAKVKK